MQALENEDAVVLGQEGRREIRGQFEEQDNGVNGGG